MKASRAELTLSDLMRVEGGEVTLAGLIEANLVPESHETRENHRLGRAHQGLRHQGQGHYGDQGRKSAVESAGGRFEA